MLSEDLLSADQNEAIDVLYSRNATLLYGKMGNGKTVCTLTAVQDLLRDKIIKRLLIIGTLEVCKTVWPFEAQKWEHLQALEVVPAIGSVKERLKAINSGTKIVCINFENVAWFVKEFGRDHDFDGLVIDELSKYRDVSGSGYKALKKIKQCFKWRAGLTGTPASEDWVGLYGQALMLDDGYAFGTRKDRFLQTYFYPTDFDARKWALRAGCEGLVVGRLKHLIHTMPDYRDQLPPLSVEEVPVTLSQKLLDDYKYFAKHSVLNVEGETVSAVNAAVLSGKLQQFSQGFLYNEDYVEYVHDEKLKAFKQCVEETDGPLLVVLWFSEDRVRLLEEFPDAEVYGGKNSADQVKRWNEGKIKLLFIHPRSAAHGLNLAKGGHELLFYAPFWSRDLWEQVIARLWRTGQTHPVRARVLMATGTVDHAVRASVDDKGRGEALFDAHLRALLE